MLLILVVIGIENNKDLSFMVLLLLGLMLVKINLIILVILEIIVSSIVVIVFKGGILNRIVSIVLELLFVGDKIVLIGDI